MHTCSLIFYYCTSFIKSIFKEKYVLVDEKKREIFSKLLKIEHQSNKEHRYIVISIIITYRKMKKGEITNSKHF